MIGMRKSLVGFALVAALACCGATRATAADVRAEKSPLAALAKKVNKVELADERSEKTRAWMLGMVEKASGSLREGNFCEALKGLFEFRFHVSRFESIGRLTKDGKDHGELLSLAREVAREIEKRAERAGLNCPGPY